MSNNCPYPEPFDKWCSENNPGLLDEWHPTKNGDLKPSDVYKGSHRKVWWLGKCGHEWESAIYSRVSGKGCPVCYGRKVVVGFNDLQTVNPELAKEWHPTKNGDLKPTDVVGSSNKKVWWMCKNGHEWQAAPNTRKRGNGCRICAGQAIIPGVNDLQSQRPDLIDSWDFDKNNISPNEIAVQSNAQVWWKCNDCGHTWKAAPYARIRSSCPKCAYDLHSSFGEKAIVYYLSTITPLKERYRDKFLGKMELDIYIPSLRTAIEYDGRFYHDDIEKDRRKNEKCRRNNIELIRFRETGCPPIDSYVIEVEPLDHSTLTKGINELVQYLKSKHGIKGELDIDVERDSVAINELKYLSRKDNSLSLKYSEIAKEWHPVRNGVLKPDVVPAHSNMKVWWICKEGHEWQARVKSRVEGQGCPYCAGRRVMAGFNDLITTHPHLAEEWHPTKNGELKPTDVSKGSHKRVWWMCKNGHEWETPVYHRTGGRKCPYCAGKKKD